MKPLLLVLTLVSITLASAAEEIGMTGLWIVDRKNADEPLRTGMVWPKSAADKAGIKSGLFLIAVDGTNVVRKSATEATSMVRGPVGAVVMLEIADASRSATNNFTLRRGRAVIHDNRLTNANGFTAQRTVQNPKCVGWAYYPVLSMHDAAGDGGLSQIYWKLSPMVGKSGNSEMIMFAIGLVQQMRRWRVNQWIVAGDQRHLIVCSCTHGTSQSAQFC